MVVGFLSLAGCLGTLPAAGNTATPAETSTPTPIPVCGKAGTIQKMVLDSPTQGYDYEYAMYLPPCYATERGQSYPVLYLIPGRSSSFEAWFNAGAAQVADEMIHAGEIPPVLVVATGGTDNDADATLIHDDLVPYIESAYRIRPERRYHAVAGASLGGVATYRIVFRDPGRFASAGIFGNGATKGEEKRIRGWLAAMNEADKPRVFFNVGFADPYMLDRAKALIAILDEYQIYHAEIFSEGDHSYPYWVKNFPDYLRWLAEDWR